jgi:multiple sugar transport system permease protein
MAQDSPPVSTPVNFSTRVDNVGWRPRAATAVRATIAILPTLIILIPVFWMGMTAFKPLPDAVSVPPTVFFSPTLEGFVNLFTQRRQLTQSEFEQYRERDDLSWADEIVLQRQQTIIGRSQFAGQLINSFVISGTSTVLSVVFAVLAAYAFSRFNVPGKDDLLFFILSQRMLPAVVVTVAIFRLYRQLGLYDTHLGMILLYTSFNLSFAVWLLKGFIDEIPREYEEAALVDGYTRLQAFRKIVLPQATTGIAATTVFSFIFSWNEYAFALMLTSERARTAPPSIPLILGSGGIEWSTIAAGSMLFLVPVVIVTFALRNHLLRGVTFGAIRKG